MPLQSSDQALLDQADSLNLQAPPQQSPANQAGDQELLTQAVRAGPGQYAATENWVSTEPGGTSQQADSERVAAVAGFGTDAKVQEARQRGLTEKEFEDYHRAAYEDYAKDPKGLVNGKPQSQADYRAEVMGETSNNQVSDWDQFKKLEMGGEKAWDEHQLKQARVAYKPQWMAEQAYNQLPALDLSAPHDSERRVWDAKFKTEFDRPMTDAEWKEFQNTTLAYKYGDKAVNNKLLSPSALAAQIPDDLRDQASQAAGVIASREKPTGQMNYLQRAGMAFTRGTAGVMDLAGDQLMGYGAKTRAAGAKLASSADAPDPLTGEASNPLNWPLHALEMAPSLMVAGAAGKAAGAAAKFFGPTAALAKSSPEVMKAYLATQKVAQVASEAGSAASFSPGMFTSAQNRLLNEGVDPTVAKWTAVGQAVVGSAIFAKLPGQVFGTAAKDELAQFATRTWAGLITQHVKNFGTVMTETAAVNLVNQLSDRTAKYASGLSKSPEYAQGIGDAIKETLLGAGPMALIMAPHMIGDARAMTKQNAAAEAGKAAVNRSNDFINRALDYNKAQDKAEADDARKWLSTTDPAAWAEQHPAEAYRLSESGNYRPDTLEEAGLPRIYGEEGDAALRRKFFAGVRQHLEQYTPDEQPPAETPPTPPPTPPVAPEPPVKPAETPPETPPNKPFNPVSGSTVEFNGPNGKPQTGIVVGFSSSPTGQNWHVQTPDGVLHIPGEVFEPGKNPGVSPAPPEEIQPPDNVSGEPKPEQRVDFTLKRANGTTRDYTGTFKGSTDDGKYVIELADGTVRKIDKDRVTFSQGESNGTDGKEETKPAGPAVGPGEGVQPTGDGQASDAGTGTSGATDGRPEDAVPPLRRPPGAAPDGSAPSGPGSGTAGAGGSAESGGSTSGTVKGPIDWSKPANIDFDKMEQDASDKLGIKPDKPKTQKPAGEKKPPKPRRADDKQPGPEKGSLQQDLKKPAAIQSAQDEADADKQAFIDMMKGFTDAGTNFSLSPQGQGPPINDALAKAALKMVFSHVKAEMLKGSQGLKYADMVNDFLEKIGPDATSKAERYFDYAWNYIKDQGAPIDAPSPVRGIIDSGKVNDDGTTKQPDTPGPTGPPGMGANAPPSGEGTPPVGTPEGTTGPAGGTPGAIPGELPVVGPDSAAGHDGSDEGLGVDSGHEGGTPGGRMGDGDKQPDSPEQKTGATDTSRKPSGRDEAPIHYRLSAADAIDSAGAATKFDRNMAAVKLLKQIEGEGRRATPEEQKTLAKMTGWGQLYKWFYLNKTLRDAGLIDKKTGQFNLDNLDNLDKLPEPGRNRNKAKPDDIEDDRETPDKRRALDLLRTLTREEYESAREATQWSHYTSLDVAGGIWDLINRQLGGLRKGSLRILDPCSGNGVFWGTMPSELLAHAQMLGIDPDPIALRIAKQLYQGSRFDGRTFENVPMADGYHDIIASNPPFSDAKIADPFDAWMNKPQASLHNYFFLKAARKVRPGGVVAFVTSHFTMDAMDAGVRNRLKEAGMNLVGAVRLPNDAFNKIAGTRVTTDIIFLQKGGKTGHDWAETRPLQLDWAKGNKGNGSLVHMQVNEYFHDHPEQVVGRLSANGTMRGPNPELTVESRGGDLGQKVRTALSNLQFDRQAWEDGVGSTEAAAEDVRNQVPVPENLRHVGQGRLVLHDDKLWVRNGDYLDLHKKLTPGGEDIERAKSWMNLRDSLLDLQGLQRNPSAGDGVINDARTKLNEVYDAFVKKYGPVGRTHTNSMVRGDYDVTNVAALEKYNKKTSTQPESAVKADIFRLRTEYPYKEPTFAAGPKEAMAICMRNKGELDIDHIGDLLEQSPEDAAKSIAPFVLKDPEGGYEIRETYLSGNVRRKLEIAKQMAKSDPRYNENVVELQKVLPPDMGPGQIGVLPGSAWLPESVQAAFLRDTLGLRDAKATKRGAPMGGWHFDFGHDYGSTTQETDAYGVKTHGSTHFWGSDLWDKIVNTQPISVRLVASDGTFLPAESEEATNLAKVQANKLKTAFANWIWAAPTRAENLTALYNKIFRSTVEPTWPSWAVSTAGLTEYWKNNIRPEQLAGIARTIFGGNTLLAYGVGRGKTLMGVVSCMEKRRLGIARKNVIVAPNHLVDQWGSSAQEYYPGAKVLVAGPDDFGPQNRPRFINKVRTGDWDMVIIPESSFKRIPMSPGTVRNFFDTQLAEMEDMIARKTNELGKNDPSVKDMEKARKKFEKRMDKMLDASAKDTGPYFDELGIDNLVVDEAQDFKNLFFQTANSQIPGINPTGNQKTFDMLMKTDFLHELTSGKGVTFLTGTPIANTMGEAYTMMRYLQPEIMKQMGAYAFDDWKSMFGDLETTNRIDPLGRKYRPETRFNKFINLADLRRMWAQTADIKMGYAPGAKIPPLAGGAPQAVEVAADPLVKDYMMGLARRAATMDPRDPKTDNILKAMTEGRKMATDPRLMEAAFPEPSQTKLAAAAKNMLDIYHETTPFSGVQAGWLDLGTPKKAKKLTPAMVSAGEWVLQELQDSGEISMEDLRAKFDEIATGSKKRQFGRWLKQIEQDVEYAYCDEDDDDAHKLHDEDQQEGTQAVYINGITRADPNVTSEKAPPWNAYQEIKDQLMKGGVPENEIAFIHDFDTSVKKLALYKQLNSGEKRIILASTQKMGTGANIQERLCAEHHVDAPFRPDQLEQRRGRMLRVNNKTMELAQEAGVDLSGVRSFQYVTKGTIDARFWQILEDKARMLRQFYNGDESQREAQDVGEDPDAMAMMKARATAGPLFREEQELKSTVSRLTSEREGFNSGRFAAQQSLSGLVNTTIPGSQKYIDDYKQRIAAYEARIAALPEGANFDLTIDGKQYSTGAEAGPALMAKLLELGKHLPVLDLKDDASNFSKENHANVSALTEIGTLFGEPFYVRVNGGWYNPTTGKSIAGNSHQLHAVYSKLTPEEKAGYQWGMSEANSGTQIYDPQNGEAPKLANGTQLEASASGNIQRLGNAFKRLYADLDTEQKQLTAHERRIPVLEKEANGKFEGEEELDAASTRLEEVSRLLGSDSGEKMVQNWLPSQALVDALGPESKSAKFMLRRSGGAGGGAYIGDISGPEGKSRVFTGSPGKEELPPKPAHLWLEPKTEGAPEGWTKAEDDGKVNGQFPRATPTPLELADAYVDTLLKPRMEAEEFKKFKAKLPLNTVARMLDAAKKAEELGAFTSAKDLHDALEKAGWDTSFGSGKAKRDRPSDYDPIAAIDDANRKIEEEDAAADELHKKRWPPKEPPPPEPQPDPDPDDGDSGFDIDDPDDTQYSLAPGSRRIGNRFGGTDNVSGEDEQQFSRAANSRRPGGTPPPTAPRPLSTPKGLIGNLIHGLTNEAPEAAFTRQSLRKIMSEAGMYVKNADVAMNRAAIDSPYMKWFASAVDGARNKIAAMSTKAKDAYSDAWERGVLVSTDAEKAQLPAALQQWAVVDPAAARIKEEVRKFQDGMAAKGHRVSGFDCLAPQNLIEDYLARSFAGPEVASAVIRGIIATRMRGQPGSTKQRSFDYGSEVRAVREQAQEDYEQFKDSDPAKAEEARLRVKALKPKYDNFLDMQMAGLKEMAEWAGGLQAFADQKAAGYTQYIGMRRAPPGMDAPRDMNRNPLPPFTRRAPATIRVPENVNATFYMGLKDFCDRAGIEHEEVADPGAGVLGSHENFPQRKITTKFFTGTDQLLHEIGHDVDSHTNMRREFNADPDARHELTELADWRLESHARTPPEWFENYIQTPYEQIANAVHAFMVSPERMQADHPAAYQVVHDVLAADPTYAPLLNIKPGTSVEAIPRDVPNPFAGAIIGTTVIPEKSARMIEKYASTGWGAYAGQLQSQSGPVAKALVGGGKLLAEGLTSASRLAIMSRLAASAFHGYLATKLSLATDIMSAIQKAKSGNLGGAALSLGMAPINPVVRTIRGMMVKHWLDLPDAQLRPDQVAYKKDFIMAGGQSEQRKSHEYGRAAINAFAHSVGDLKDVNLLGAAYQGGKGAWKGLVQTLLAPTEAALGYANAIKMSVDWEQIQTARAANLGDTPEQMADRFRRIYDNNDAMLGQINWNNVFAPKRLKQLAQRFYTAIGFTGGNIAMPLGAAKDLMLTRQRMRAGGDAITDRQVMTMLGIPLAMAMCNALQQYFYTKKWPWESDTPAYDLKFPRTGEADKFGQPARLTSPGVENDWWNYAHHPVDTVMNKLSPMVSSVYHRLKGSDWYNHAIHGDQQPDETNADYAKRYATEEKDFWIREAEPISVQNLQKQADAGTPVAKRIGSFFGINDAKQRDQNSPFINAVQDALDKQHGSRAPQSPEQVADQAEARQLLADRRAGNVYFDKRLSGTANKQAAADAPKSPLAILVRGLPIAKQMDLWETASENEKNSIAAEMALKFAHSKPKGFQPAAKRAEWQKTAEKWQNLLPEIRAHLPRN